MRNGRPRGGKGIGLAVAVIALLCAAARGGASDDPWAAFYPPPDQTFDWLQLTSGEWLKGDFKVIYDQSLEFDSDELGLQEFDFEDVRRLRTRNAQTVLLERDRREMEVVRGLLEIDGKTIILRNGDEVVEVNRRELVSITPRASRERDRWSGSVSVGATLRGGNVETVDANVIANLKRRSVESRFNMDYLSNYGRSQGEETANNHRLSGYFDRFLTSRFYWKVVSAEYFRDPFSNIAGQYSVGSGVGYDLVRGPKAEWTVGAGGGYQQQRFDSVQAGEDEQSGSPFFSAGTKLDVEVSKRTDFLFDYSCRFLNDDNGRYTHHLLSTLTLDLVDDFDLDLSFVWDRTERPQAASDGSVPEQDDFQFIVGLGYEF